MLSFNMLGNMGHLANQMFQYASLRGIAKKHGYDICICPREYVGSQIPVKNSILDCFNLDTKFELGRQKTISESSFSFDKNLFENCPDGVDLHGYFQSEKYFSHIKEDILKEFTFKKEISAPAEELFESVFGEQEVISLHIRRGDYVLNPNHPVQPLEYYQKALNMLPEKSPVLIFSDDADWCNQQELFSDDRFTVSEGNDAYTDMFLQNQCTYHIICNSSFSWWGAWLAGSEKVIAPKNWFGGDCINHNTNDLYCSTWKVI